MSDEAFHTNLLGIAMQTPVLTASGTFGFGEEFADFVDLSRLGGVMVRGTTLLPRRGTTACASRRRRRACSTASASRIRASSISPRRPCRASSITA